jgi:hypothetical protein
MFVEKYFIYLIRESLLENRLILFTKNTKDTEILKFFIQEVIQFFEQEI